MKCDDVLPALETGNAWQLWRARRHLRHCSECQAAFLALNELKSSLAQPAEISPSYRQRWLAAAGDLPAHAGSRPRHLGWAAAGLATALLLVALGLWWNRNRDADNANPGKSMVQQPSDKPVPQTLAVTGEMAWQQLSDVRESLAALDAELQDVSLTIALLDEQQEVNALLAQFDSQIDP